jgi:hypothetical protein
MITWESWEATPYPSMTEKQFLSLCESDKPGTIRKLATSIASGLNTEGLTELVVGLHLGEDSPLVNADDSILLEIANEQCLIEEVGVCKFCDEPVGVDYHLHEKGFVGDDCCWDERLRSTE